MIKNKKVLDELEVSGLVAIYKIEGILKFFKTLFSYKFTISSNYLHC